MTVREATRPQVFAFVREVRDHQSKRERESSSVVAVKARPVWRHDRTIDVDGQVVNVVPCPSPLEFSRALVRHADADGMTVLLSPGDGLAADTTAKLFHGRVLELNLWQIARGLFRAQRLDPRLRGKQWIAEALIEVRPAKGYDPAGLGVLTEARAWRELLRHHLQLEREEPTLPDLLRWAMRPEHGSSFSELPADRRSDYGEWLADRVGPVAPRVLAMVAAGDGAQAVPAGLALGVLHHESAGDGLTKARLKFDVKVLGDDTDLEPTAARAWASAAESIVRQDLSGESAAVARTWSEAAEDLLAKVGGSDHAFLSNVLTLGRRQRQERFAKALTAVVDESGSPDALPAALSAVTDHSLGPGESLGRALDLSVKLARWTRSRSAAEPKSLGEAFRVYRENGSFVDWCRRRIAEHTSHSRVGPALTKLLMRVDAWREEENRRFGDLVTQEATHYSTAGDVVPIESVLDRVVVPVAKAGPVLLLVLDGMALDVCHELLEPLINEGWVECRPGTDEDRWSVLTAFPTVTECCRSSLLAGKLVRGAQGAEKKAFAAHQGLVSAAGDSPPIVFHKKDLDGNGKDGDPVDVVADTERPVVAVVLNTIDDLLAAGDKLRPEWTPETIKHLDHLLEAAREAKRTIVVTSDHGHVLERDMNYCGTSSDQESERWRQSEAEPAESERRLGAKHPGQPRLQGTEVDGVGHRRELRERKALGRVVEVVAEGPGPEHQVQEALGAARVGELRPRQPRATRRRRGFRACPRKWRACRRAAGRPGRRRSLRSSAPPPP